MKYSWIALAAITLPTMASNSDEFAKHRTYDLYRESSVKGADAIDIASFNFTVDGKPSDGAAELNYSN